MGTVEAHQAQLQAKAWSLFQTSERVMDRKVIIEIDQTIAGLKTIADDLKKALPSA